MSLSGNSTSSFATSNSLNETFSNTSAGSSRMSQKEIAILMPIYSISLLAALIGNFLIIVVFYMYKPIQKNINYFVVNMAISDLFTPLTIMPFKIAESLSNGTFLSQLPSSLSEVLCKLCFFLADTSILVSIISLMLISVDRLIAVVFPLQIKLISRKVRFICILMSWVVAISVHTPYLAVFAFKGGCFKEWDIETNNSENYRAGLKHIVCGRSRAGSISSSATKKLTSSAKRTRNSSSNHFSITGIGGSEKEWLKLAGRIRIVATDKTKVTTSTEEHKF
ncbi:neuropeptide Y receptor type 2-like [Acropora palmata]|uniref:neuropeptide Y receptor type 2-like n=1 Tax=Acropora palmata TaxID=6131 RepID=UPI003DA0AD89